MTDAGRIPLDEPLAYFLTWPTYGTWLPGDERGWVQHGRGIQLPDALKKQRSAERMVEEACILSHDERRVVESTIIEHCRIRGWTLHAVNCRSNHLHVVVTASEHPDEVRDQFKAWCTRRLKELQRSSMHGGTKHASAARENWWAARGSKRFINDMASLEAAILYVRDAQDVPH